MAYGAPDYYLSVPKTERAQRCKLTSDLCSVDDEHFFIRALCRLPIEGSEQEFGWGVWVSLSEQNFQRYFDSYDDPDQSKLGGMFGWFSNQLPDYPDTLSLQTTVVPQDSNQRPLVYISEVHQDHPLFIEQRRGISEAKLAKLYAENLCGRSGSS